MRVRVHVSNVYIYVSECECGCTCRVCINNYNSYFSLTEEFDQYSQEGHLCYSLRNIKHTHLPLEQTVRTDDLVEDVSTNVSVNSRERVVEEIDSTVLIHGPRQAHSLLLTAAQVDALLQTYIDSDSRSS